MGVNSCGTTLIDEGTFKNIGAITWDTTVKTSGFTAVSGNGYFCNTTSAAFTVTLPASPSAGDLVAIADYANTFDTNNVTIGRNGSNIQGSASDFKAEIEGLSITLIYVDGTQGWLSVDAAQASDIVRPQFVTATGGTITCSGDYKIHTFTGPGTFCVSQIGNCVGGPSNVDYLVVAGGGGGGQSSSAGGGGGAGGFRESSGTASGCYTASPLGACVSALPVSVTGYPIVIGAGGNGRGGAPINTSGSLSSFSTITSAGGGLGGDQVNVLVGGNGGSGGGGSSIGATPSAAGTGNTPPVSPPQGNNGGLGNTAYGQPYTASGGGGGATVAGGDGNGPKAGGAGATTSISASPTAYAGGGGGASRNIPEGGGAGGVGGGGNGSSGGNNDQENGTVNTGGGGGGLRTTPTPVAGNGGSGIVIIRYKFQ